MDYVFLLNNKAQGMGFPSQIADAPILQLLLDNCDHYPFAEERCLFYVAITRARKKVWLVVIKENESVFVKEIDAAYGDFYGCSNYRTTGCRYIRNIAKSGKQIDGR